MQPAWVNRGGIVGRGVLLDYVDYASRNNITINALETSVIPLSTLKQIAHENGITFRPGDILFVRSGFTRAYEKLSVDDARTLGHRPESQFIGVESSEAMLRWLWENQFAAVAGDAVAFESCPIAGPQAQVPPEYSLHQWCLAGWGMPLGEMFNLEELAAYCREKKRWTFFLASVPLKVIPPRLSRNGLIICLLTDRLTDLFRSLVEWPVLRMRLLLCSDRKYRNECVIMQD
jgi:hypothetical protein